jgi:alkylmercury lyase
VKAVSAELPEEVMALRNVGFRALYESGRPVTLETLASRSGYSVARVEEILASPELIGRSRFDDKGRLVGIAGLSVEKTRHEIGIDGRTLWTWCALDAVGIFSALGESGWITTTPPDTSDPMTIEVVDGISASDPILFILGGFDGLTSVQAWCPSVNFFNDRASAVEWANSNNLDGQVVAASEVEKSAGEVWAPVVAGIGVTDG